MVNRLPVTAAVSQMLALLKLSLLKGTTHTGVAVSVHAEAEPRTSNANLSGIAALHHTIIGVRPFLPAHLSR